MLESIFAHPKKLKKKIKREQNLVFQRLTRWVFQDCWASSTPEALLKTWLLIYSLPLNNYKSYQSHQTNLQTSCSYQNKDTFYGFSILLHEDFLDLQNLI